MQSPNAMNLELSSSCACGNSMGAHARAAPSTRRLFLVVQRKVPISSTGYASCGRLRQQRDGVDHIDTMEFRSTM
jgi:hypothetical protein